MCREEEREDMKEGRKEGRKDIKAGRKERRHKPSRVANCTSGWPPSHVARKEGRKEGKKG